MDWYCETCGYKRFFRNHIHLTNHIKKYNHEITNIYVKKKYIIIEEKSLNNLRS